MDIKVAIVNSNNGNPKVIDVVKAIVDQDQSTRTISGLWSNCVVDVEYKGKVSKVSGYPPLGNDPGYSDMPHVDLADLV